MHFNFREEGLLLLAVLLAVAVNGLSINNNNNNIVRKKNHHHYHQQLSSTSTTLNSSSYDSQNNEVVVDEIFIGIVTDDDNTKGVKNSRRGFLSNVAALSSSVMISNVAVANPGIAAASEIVTPVASSDLSWPLGKVAFSLLPLAGTSTRRATVEETIVPDVMWTHDQIQGVVNVNVPVRQVVVKLSKAAGGGLFVYNPIAPTPQLLSMMRELEAQYGPVRHIVLGTVALEHKATFGPFAQKFPNATVWFQQGQWSFPFQLPLEVTGVLQRREKLREIPLSSDGSVEQGYRYWNNKEGPPEWMRDFDYETLGPLKFQSVGAYSETAFFHKATKTLIVTDCVCKVSDTPPPIIEEDPRAMLFHARDSINEVVIDTEETRKKGWRRMVQFGLVFFPSQIDVVPFGRAIKEASKIDGSMKPLGEGAVPASLYPWTWHDNDVDKKNFDAIVEGGLFCPPILTKLILDREPDKTINWVNRICERFDFNRVIPAHLDNNVKATPDEFSRAFNPLRSNPKTGKFYPQRPLPEDLALLQEASDLLTKVGVVGPSKVCDGEPARVIGRFANLQ